MPTSKKMISQILKLVAEHCGWTLTEEADHDRLNSALNAVKKQQTLNEQDFFTELLTNSDLLRQLVDQLVIPETYFFRYARSFEYLRKLAVRWLAENNAGIFRVASIPSATGEESYSIAMILHDAGIPLERLAIDAVDVSEPLIEKSKRGIYSKNCLIRHPLVAQEKYFDEVEGGLQVKADIRERVNFMPGNVKTLPSAFFATGYQIVFCRNLLIYLSDEIREALFKQLQLILKTEGTLFVGPAEVSFFLQKGMTAARESQVFSLQFNNETKFATPVKKKILINSKLKNYSSVVTKPTPLKPVTRILRNDPAVKTQKKTSPASRQPTNDRLADVRRIADAGDLKEAYRMSEMLLNRDKSVSCFLLHGELLLAMNKVTESIQIMKKVLYLEAENETALSHLVLLYRRNGDLKQAAHYQQSLTELRN